MLKKIEQKKNGMTAYAVIPFIKFYSKLNYEAV